MTRAITSISAATEYTIRSASFLNMLVDCREKLTGFWSKGRKSDYSWLECVWTLAFRATQAGGQREGAKKSHSTSVYHVMPHNHVKPR